MRKILAAAAVLLNAHIIFVVLLRLLSLVQQYLPKAAIMWLGLNVFLVNLFPFYLLLSTKNVFIGWIILTPLLSIAMLIRRGRARWLFVVGLLAYGYFIYGLSHYQPAIEFNEGVQWFWVDQPKGVVELMYQTVLAQAEGRSRHYEIVGWQDNQTLIFKKASKRKWNEDKIGWDLAGQQEIFTYRWGGSQELIEMVPAVETVQLCEFKDCIGPYVNQGWNVTPKKVYLSPDRKHAVFIVEHIYGPQDIIVLNKEP